MLKSVEIIASSYREINTLIQTILCLGRKTDYSIHNVLKKSSVLDPTSFSIVFAFTIIIMHIPKKMLFSLLTKPTLFVQSGR